MLRNIYNRQQKLWDQGIGTEVQTDQCKKFSRCTRKTIGCGEGKAGKHLLYMRRSVVLPTRVNVKAGEIFIGVSPTGRKIQIVNSQQHESGNRLFLKITRPM
jgi:hypothetical protein